MRICQIAGIIFLSVNSRQCPVQCEAQRKSHKKESCTELHVFDAEPLYDVDTLFITAIIFPFNCHVKGNSGQFVHAIT